ncbi:MAG: hypothetical protein Q8R44_15730 [Novosphingobium sp.]|nr:hypothetical protein [Novosphingobium sp.]
MTRTSKLLGAAGIFTLAALAAQPAFAAGTTAGSTITNTATVNYQVGGISQNATTASDTLTVDRKVNLTVAEVGTVTTEVVPGLNTSVTTFTVTNTSNATLDFALSVLQQSGGVTAHGGTDNFDVTALVIAVDSNGNGTYDPVVDLLVTHLDEIAADASRTVFVVANVPLGLANGAVAGVTLTATGREAGSIGLQGAALTETAGANTAGMDTVFADGAGATDASRDAAFSALDDYTVSTATLSVIKSSTIISDPLNGTTNPKFIPGAVIQYCIAVTNAASAASATSVAVSDPLPGGITYDSLYGIKLDGTVVTGVCQADGTAGGSFASNTVSGTIASLPAGSTKTVLFRATIN